MPAGGGIIQIAAKGRQNEYLNQDPAFNLFRNFHNKYTNFAEDFEFNDMNGVITFGAQKAPSTISRYGDLITDLHVWFSLPPLAAPANGTWNAKVTVNDDGTTTPVLDDSGNQVYLPTGAYWVNAIQTYHNQQHSILFISCLIHPSRSHPKHNQTNYLFISFYFDFNIMDHSLTT